MPIYSACLRDRAWDFKSTRVMPGSVAKNVYGVELWRRNATETETAATVNDEFAAIYRRIYNSESPSLADVMLDAAVGGHKSALIRGTRALMVKHSCDSPVIKTFEEGMRAVFEPLHLTQ